MVIIKCYPVILTELFFAYVSSKLCEDTYCVTAHQVPPDKTLCLERCPLMAEPWSSFNCDSGIKNIKATWIMFQRTSHALQPADRWVLLGLYFRFFFSDMSACSATVWCPRVTHKKTSLNCVIEIVETAMHCVHSDLFVNNWWPRILMDRHSHIYSEGMSRLLFF